MAVRKIINIDESLCDGCGDCVPACPEGAIRVVNGKARLAKESCCDGLGACLGECPRNAITIEEREAAEFDPGAVRENMKRAAREEESRDEMPMFSLPGGHGGCPGSRPQTLARPFAEAGLNPEVDSGKYVSKLRNWPVQLHLAPVRAPYFDNAELLICADCVPFASPDFHERLLDGRTVVVGCPKLDETETYLRKLAAIFAGNNIRAVHVAVMEVPCCTGLVQLVRQALINSGAELPLTLWRVMIGDGRVERIGHPDMMKRVF
jgi:ferredoxin